MNIGFATTSFPGPIGRNMELCKTEKPEIS